MPDYKALYLKWRPTDFSGVHGQEHITSILKQQIITGRTSHAYLFCGTRGTGKTTCARILAKAVNCLALVDGNPCNKCDICRGIDSGTILEINEIDAASNNGVDNIRGIREDLVYSPGLAKTRIYIIDEVHMLSIGAFNALLKTLEEPPSHTMFILATTELRKIPLTVLSRTQRFDFRRISTDVIIGRLNEICAAEKINAEPDALRLIAGLAGGAFRDAINLLETCAGSDSPVITYKSARELLGAADRSGTLELINAVANGNAALALQIFWDFYAAGGEPSVFLTDLGETVRDLQITLLFNDSLPYINAPESVALRMKESAPKIGPLKLSIYAAQIGETYKNLTRAAQNKRIAVELLLIKLSTPNPAPNSTASTANFGSVIHATSSGSIQNSSAKDTPVLDNPEKSAENTSFSFDSAELVEAVSVENKLVAAFLVKSKFFADPQERTLTIIVENEMAKKMISAPETIALISRHTQNFRVSVEVSERKDAHLEQDSVLELAIDSAT